MINIISPINQLGYGIAGLNLVKSLAEKTEVSLFPIGQIEVKTQQDFDIIKRCVDKSTLPDFDSPCIRIWHQHDMSQFVGKGQHIAFPFFELNKFSSLEKHHLNSVDSIFVTSSWAKEICLRELNHADDNIKVVPLGVDINIFRPLEPNNVGKTIFFNCGKWEKRKGHDILPEIFNTAFNDDDDVELWMMNSNPFLDEEGNNKWKRLYIESNIGHKIRFIDRLNTQQEVYNIMEKVDCGIFPSRAEGWNLELLEMMSCGKSVITTNYSAHTEFCDKENAYLVNIETEEVANDGVFFRGDIGDWAHIGQKQIKEFSDHMRHVYELKQKNMLQGNSHGITTAKKFNWNYSAQKVILNV